MDNNTEKEVIPEEAVTEATEKAKKPKNLLREIFEIVEMLGLVSACVMLLFAFALRLNVVDGHSMDKTLAGGEYLVVTDLFYEPTAGDIVVIHDITATPYDKPLVKRVIAVENQVVDIDFATWTLTVDGKVVEEPYRYLDPARYLTAEYSFPITVPEGEIFVLGDNRHNSADSRQIEIGTVDERCVVGKAIARIFPLSKLEIFKNPFEG